MEVSIKEAFASSGDGGGTKPFPVKKEAQASFGDQGQKRFMQLSFAANRGGSRLLYYEQRKLSPPPAMETKASDADKATSSKVLGLRRPPFDWEIDRWNLFLAFFESISIRKHISDTIAWTGCSNSMFTVSSFRNSVWTMVLTPSALFTILERRQQTKFSFCDAGRNSYERNKLIFEGVRPLIDQAADLIKFRIVRWFKHFKKGSTESITTLLLNFTELCVESKKFESSQIQDWIPHAVECLKFNVDGSSKGNSGPAVIGWVLRDSKSKVLYLFSQSVGIMDSNSAEILAIKRAVELCFSQQGLHHRNVIIISDSKSAVSWVNGDYFGCLNHVDIIWEIHNLIQPDGGS
ncbi:hypothetical protein Dsin_012009 [Dipteronia sinensis]|uniref:RNase H type-1 domain-containing protein n=1 Tax=Dipteronia sinensis TaxID=43782 RepID=A0AAE0AII3_9ROSI|nr:hypothetical protein Dsin_012009 [Dipteronia sinensis]